MSRKKMYRLLAFIIFTFALLAVVVSVELNRYANRSGEQLNNAGQNSADSENTADGNQSTDDNSGTVPGNASTKDSGSGTAGNTAGDTQEDDTVPWEDIILLFSGDVNITDYVKNKYNQEGIGGILSEDLLEEFNNADIAMVNQEFAFTDRGTPVPDKQYTFRVEPKYVQIFKDMQVDIASLANNHSMDFGIVGLTDTFDTLTNAGIRYAGAGNNITEAREINYFEIRDKKITCLAASRVIPEPGWNAYSNKAGMLTTYDPSFLLEDIKAAKAGSDFVAVYVHWGLERKEYPEEYQRKLAEQYIDAGADLVVGSHPHVLQGIEYYNGKPIVYSLGNFMFYNSIKQTALLQVTLNEKTEADIRLIPGKAVNARTQGLDSEADIAEFYRHMTEISFDIDFDSEGNVIR